MKIKNFLLFQILVFVLSLLFGCSDNKLLTYDEYLALTSSDIAVRCDQTNVSSSGVFYYNDVNVNSPKSVIFTIENKGRSPLKIKKVYLNGDSWFSISSEISVNELEQSKETTFTVVFNPINGIEPQKTANVIIETNDPDGDYKITINATGIPEGQVFRPVLSLKGDLYQSPITVSLSCSTSNSVIRYTTDGNDPSETYGVIYTAPIPISTLTVLKVIAYKTNCSPSAIVKETYVISYSPDIVLSSGSVNLGNNGEFYIGEVNLGTSKSITFTIKNNGNYNLDLSGNPKVAITGDCYTVSSQPALSTIGAGGTSDFIVDFTPLSAADYTAVISIANSDITKNPYVLTLKGKGIPSNQVRTPDFSITSGSYQKGTAVTLSCGTSGAVVYYKINGGTEQTYTTPVIFNSSGIYTLETYAKKSGMIDSGSSIRTYDISGTQVVNVTFTNQAYYGLFFSPSSVIVQSGGSLSLKTSSSVLSSITSGWKWYIDNTEQTAQTTSAFTWNPSTTDIGSHIINVSVLYNGVLYSGSIKVTVTY